MTAKSSRPRLLVGRFTRTAHDVVTLCKQAQDMSSPRKPDVIALPIGTPAESGTPGLLVEPTVVLVPRPPQGLVEPSDAVEVIVIAPGAPVPVERIRAKKAVPLGPPSALTLRIELNKPSVNTPTPIRGAGGADSLDDLVSNNHGDDLWATLRSSDRVPELPPKPSSDTLSALHANEPRPRPKLEVFDRMPWWSWIGAQIAGILNRR